MRWLSGALAGVLTALLLFHPAWAETYTDTMAGALPDETRSYQGLGPRSIPLPAGAPTRGGVSFASQGALQGHVTYYIEGAEEIRVGLYSYTGTFVNRAPGVEGCVLGPAAPSLAYLQGQGLTQALVSISGDGIFARVDGQLCRLAYASPYYQFLPWHESPSDLRSYGLEVSASSGGQTYSRLPLSLSASDIIDLPGLGLVYEEYTARIPSGMAYVRVAINDTTRLWVRTVSGGGAETFTSVPRQPEQLVALGLVELSGAELYPGGKPAAPSEPDPPDESSSRPPESSREESSASESSRDDPGSHTEGPSQGQGSSSREEPAKGVGSSRPRGRLTNNRPDSDFTLPALSPASRERTEQRLEALPPAGVQPFSPPAAAGPLSLSPSQTRVASSGGASSAPAARRAATAGQAPAIWAEEPVQAASPARRAAPAVTVGIIALSGTLFYILLRKHSTAE